jgi:dipeptidyl aminopeptidase/acylaminoacyl peptidase
VVHRRFLVSCHPVARCAALGAFATALLVVPPCSLAAQGAAPRTITPADISAWKSVRGATLSHDGRWFAYLQAPSEGDAVAVFRQTAAGGTEHRIPVGEVPAGVTAQLSANGAWGAVLVYPTAAEQKRLRRERRPVQAKAVLVELGTGQRRTVEKVRRVLFSGDAPTHVALHAYGPDAPAGGGGATGALPAPGAPGMGGTGGGGGTPRVEGTDLWVMELATGTVLSMGNVADVAFDAAGRFLATVIDGRDRQGNGVQLRTLATGAVTVLDGGTALYRRLGWSDSLPSLAFLRGTVDSAGTDTTWAAVGVRAIGTPAQQLVRVGAGATAALPAGMEVSPDRAPRWMEGEDALAIGLRVADAPLPRGAQLEDDDRPSLILWHGKDRRLQSMQLVQEQADKGFSFLATYQPAAPRVVPLTDDVLRTGTLGGGDRWVLASDNAAYERRASVDGIQKRDWYVVNARTGARTRVGTALTATVQLSPDGRTVLYWEDGHWHAFDLARGAAVNITAGAPVSFVDTEDDHNVDRPPTRVVGFAKDGASVLLHDNWDVWQVALAGGRWVNLSGNGRREGIRYARRVVVDPRERGIDLAQPLTMVAMRERTKQEAVVQLRAAKPGAVVLSGWKDARLAPVRAAKADVWVSTIQTFARFPDWWRVSWANGASGDSVRLTDANPGMNGVAWSPGARLVTYVSDKGDTLQGALYLPAGYREGTAYPTVVHIYEQLSDQLHQFSAPAYTSSTTPGLHTARGYAVFQPDIRYTVNDPGMSAVWSVIPGVKAAIRTGIVDSARIGLHGHSWGGYQTAFLVGQTTLFKSAVAGAPLTDMVSMYSSVYWNTGNTNQAIFQSSQGRFKGNFLENREAYERNSPNRYADRIQTPLLILHNDKDGAVDFNQGITFYNTLRQLDKDVILLEYPGENHGLAQLKNRRDYTLRLQDFWDHHLKGAPAERWLRDGIPRLELEAHLRERKARQEPIKP